MSKDKVKPAYHDVNGWHADEGAAINEFIDQCRAILLRAIDNKTAPPIFEHPLLADIKYRDKVTTDLQSFLYAVFGIPNAVRQSGGYYPPIELAYSLGD